MKANSTNFIKKEILLYKARLAKHWCQVIWFLPILLALRILIFIYEYHSDNNFPKNNDILIPIPIIPIIGLALERRKPITWVRNELIHLGHLDVRFPKKSNNHSSQFHHWRLWKCITAKNVYAYPPPVSPLLSPSLFVFFMCAKLHYLYFAYCIANTLVTLFELCQSIFGYRLARMPGKNYIIFGSHDY